MPTYDYLCEANGRTVEVSHAADLTLTIWGQVCYAGQVPLGDTDPMAPVRKVLTRAPAVATAPGPSELRNLGFKKLVRRGEGTYEDVTSTGRGARLHHADAPDRPDPERTRSADGSNEP